MITSHPLRFGLATLACCLAVLLSSTPCAGQTTTTTCGSQVCFNNGNCVEGGGSADFSKYQLPDGTYHEHIHPTTAAEYHCECTDEWTGVHCDVPVRSCADGRHYCLHNGQCVLDDDNHLFCDCSTAVSEEGIRYVGKWCEHAEANHCNDEDKFAFCLHGATCNPGFPTNGAPPCACAPGFSGPHCEYDTSSNDTHDEDDEISENPDTINLPDCVLPCQNGGLCKLGLGEGREDEYQVYLGGDDTDGEDYQYCECPAGFHGELCEVSSVPCGTNRCYHGSSCLTKQDEGHVRHHCDCRTAGNETVFYAGRYCQYESNVVCTPGDETSHLQGHLFCVNSGTCQDNPHFGCDCKEDYHGFSCEYKIDPDEASSSSPLTPVDSIEDGYDSVEVANCTLHCNGHGTCRKGAKDIEALGVAAQGTYLNETYSDSFEHCICEPGFIGLQCEHRITMCPSEEDGGHFCLHNGTCIDDRDGTFGCDCSTASGPLAELFTGDHCQAPSISCHDPSDPDAMVTSYCANGGVCRGIAGNDGQHVGCDCSSDWEGDFCAVSVVHSSVEAESETANKTLQEAFLVVVFVLAVLLFIVVYIPRILRRRRASKNSRKAVADVDWNTSQYEDAIHKVKGDAIRRGEETCSYQTNLSPVAVDGAYTVSSSRDPMTMVYLGPERDEDGHELCSVDII